MRTMMVWFSMLCCVLPLSSCSVDGGPGMILDRSWWRSPGVLRVALWAFAPGRPGPEAFELEDESGERQPGEADCLNERCLVTFEDVDEPKLLWRRVGDDERAAPLLECDEDPFGLCPFGFTCVDRTCTPLCSASHPAGACIEDGAICDDGWCAFPDG